MTSDLHFSIKYSGHQFSYFIQGLCLKFQDNMLFSMKKLYVNLFRKSETLIWHQYNLKMQVDRWEYERTGRHAAENIIQCNEVVTTTTATARQLWCNITNASMSTTLRFSLENLFIIDLGYHSYAAPTRYMLSSSSKKIILFLPTKANWTIVDILTIFDAAFISSLQLTNEFNCYLIKLVSHTWQLCNWRDLHHQQLSEESGLLSLYTIWLVFVSTLFFMQPIFYAIGTVCTYICIHIAFPVKTLFISMNLYSICIFNMKFRT